VLLTAGPDLPAPTDVALRALSVADAVVVGGTAAVPAVTEAAVRRAVPRTARVAGANRYATAVALTTAAAPSAVWLASGANRPDALVAAPAAARTGGVLLLSDPGDLAHAPATADWLAGRDGVAMLVLVGGTGSLTDAVGRQAATALGGVAAPPQPAQPPATAPGPVTGPPPGLAAAAPADLSGALRWSDPATWGGAKPVEGGRAVVPAGTTILLDEQPPRLAAIEVRGTLVVADRPMTIRTGSLLVHGRDARLVAGQESAPLRSRVELVLDDPARANVHGMGANVLGAMDGAAIDLHGAAPEVPWTRLAETAGAGSDTLRLQQPVAWRPGDELVVASTSLDPTEAERATIAAVDVRLTAPLRHTHWGQTTRIDGRDVPMHAEVGLLTRSLVVRGPDHQPDGFGGHTMAMGGATFRATGVELRGMGQRGVNARYPIHLHLLGDATGSYVRASSVHTSNQRCMTLHGSSNVLLADNVAFDAPGHCYFFEDGAETGNRLHRNLGLGTRVPAPGTALLESDATPATYWVQHPTNELIGNVAAGSAGFGFWYDLPQHPTGLSATTAITPRTEPLGAFTGNVAHSSGGGGPFKSGTGLFVESYDPPGTATFAGLLAYKNASFGVWAERSRRVTVSGAVLAGNGTGYTGPGTTLRDSLIVGATANDAARPWMQLGLGLYHNGTDVDGVTFANFAHDGQREHAAIGTIAQDTHDAARIRRARFVNVPDAARVRVVPPWAGADRATVLLDVDGSISGSPAAITSAHPILRVPGCTARPAWQGEVCPIGATYGTIRLVDATGSTEALGPVAVSRAGGGSGVVHSDPEWTRTPEASFTVQWGAAYTASLGRTTPRTFEVVLASAEPSGDVRLSVPWPHASVFVYRGWGEWATPLAPGDPGGEDAYRLAGGQLTLRPFTDEGSSWSRWLVCAERGCGEGTGSQRPGY
jgi:hypothetical protein